jgi:hypothetical protein
MFAQLVLLICVAICFLAGEFLFRGSGLLRDFTWPKAKRTGWLGLLLLAVLTVMFLFLH